MRVTRKFARAFSGFSRMLATELSVKIEVGCGLGVLAAAAWFQVSWFEFLFLMAAVFGVIILEGLNTVLERVIDLAEPRYHEAVKEIKDGLAATVLLAALGAAIVGVVIFWPYLF